MPVSYKIIRPYFRVQFDMPTMVGWVLCPFAVGDFVELVVHFVFLMAVGAEL